MLNFIFLEVLPLFPKYSPLETWKIFLKWGILIANTVWAMLEVEDWTWKVTELAFLGCLSLSRVVHLYQLVLISQLVTQGSGLNLGMWILCVEYCGCYYHTVISLLLLLWYNVVWNNIDIICNVLRYCCHLEVISSVVVFLPTVASLWKREQDWRSNSITWNLLEVAECWGKYNKSLIVSFSFSFCPRNSLLQDELGKEGLSSEPWTQEHLSSLPCKKASIYPQRRSRDWPMVMGSNLIQVSSPFLL